MNMQNIYNNIIHVEIFNIIYYHYYFIQQN